MGDHLDQDCIYCGGNTKVVGNAEVGRGTVWFCVECRSEFETEEVTRMWVTEKINDINASYTDSK